jgi:uncharacterized protein (TIGR00730 family)
MKRLAVYCGSSMGTDPAFRAAAEALGGAMAERGIGLVYGGGRLGLMGVVADAVLAGGGEALGVIPQALTDLEVAHRGLTELHTVTTMHERKAKMTELTDAFVALPAASAPMTSCSKPGPGTRSAITPSRSRFSTSPVSGTR